MNGLNAKKVPKRRIDEKYMHNKTNKIVIVPKTNFQPFMKITTFFTRIGTLSML